MKILGIVAEYDPFHRGHLHHITEAIRRASPDLVFVVLSPCFKQRGELALLSPSDRARLALEAGADAVFSLPVLWTVRDAEHYALGAVSLLSNLCDSKLLKISESFALFLISGWVLNSKLICLNNASVKTIKQDNICIIIIITILDFIHSNLTPE